MPLCRRTVVRYFSMTHSAFHMGVLCDDLTASVCSASAEMLASSPLIDARMAASLAAFKSELQHRSNPSARAMAFNQLQVYRAVIEPQAAVA